MHVDGEPFNIIKLFSDIRKPFLNFLYQQYMFHDIRKYFFLYQKIQILKSFSDIKYYDIKK